MAVLLVDVVFIFGVAFLSTLWLTHKFIHRFKRGGHVVRDMYKPGTPDIPTMGGLALIGGVLLSLIVAQFFVEEIERLLIFYFVILIYGLFGLMDDLINMKSRWKKVYVLFFLAYPIALLNIDTNLSLWFTEVEIGLFAPYLFAPLYVMVVANMINMHAGFNGLSGGLTTILLFFIGAKAYLEYGVADLLYILPILGSLLAFMYFNFYPSRIFLGNSGALFTGAAVGGLLVFYNLEFFGVIILIPHIINFLMWIYWILNMHIYPHIKFGEIREDGSIRPPNKLTMKYLVTWLFRVGELRATLILYGITSAFGVLGFLITA